MKTVERQGHHALCQPDVQLDITKDLRVVVLSNLGNMFAAAG
jgi:hypothetical protein